MVVFNLFYYHAKSQPLGMKLVFKHQDLQMFGLKFSKLNYSEPQFQVGKN